MFFFQNFAVYCVRFASVIIGSDASMRKILDHLPKKEIHGNRIVATTSTTQNLRRFEDAARKDNPAPQNGGQHNKFGSKA